MLALKNNLSEVEQDTEEAFEERPELTNLLVERIAISCSGEGRPKVDGTYRFGPPDSADSVQDSEEFAKAHGRGGSEVCCGGTPR